MLEAFRFRNAIEPQGVQEIEHHLREIKKPGDPRDMISAGVAMGVHYRPRYFETTTGMKDGRTRVHMGTITEVISLQPQDTDKTQLYKVTPNIDKDDSDYHVIELDRGRATRLRIAAMGIARYLRGSPTSERLYLKWRNIELDIELNIEVAALEHKRRKS